MPMPSSPRPNPPRRRGPKLEPLVNRILARDPDEPRGLWLSGRAGAVGGRHQNRADTVEPVCLEFVDPNGVQYVRLKKQLDVLKGQ